MWLEDLEVYNLAMDMGEYFWGIVAGWDYFTKDTVGKQLVRAADSVAANLREGFVRFHYKENNLPITAEGLSTKHGRGL